MMAISNKINKATAAHAIGSIEQLVEQVAEIIATNATEWGAGDERDACAHATATLGIAIKLLIRGVLPHFPRSVTQVPEDSFNVFLDAIINSMREVYEKISN